MSKEWDWFGKVFTGSRTLWETRFQALSKFRQKLLWHVGHSLSARQKQVIRAFLAGHKERETARVLGITQQVVNIYKQRAIKKLHKLLAV